MRLAIPKMECACVGVLILLLGWETAPARAEILEDYLQFPTDAIAGHLFLFNPAALSAGKNQAGAIGLRHTRNTVLDQTESGGDRIEADVTDDFLAASLLADLGAGALLGASHQTQYHKVETNLTTRDREPIFETMKVQHSQLKLNVELTESIRAGIAVRYLYRDAALYGSPFLSEDLLTRYRTTLVGYGSGFAWFLPKQAGLTYAYFPPLRGKTDIEGEERIVVERGEIVADGHYYLRPSLILALSYKRWINELDELATGTTAADDETEISLFGLDPDQYVMPRHCLMLGGDYELSAAATLRLALGQETAEFNFRDLTRYNRISIRQDRDDAHEEVKTNRARAGLRFVNQGIALDGGVGFFRRAYDFPDSMQRGATYEASGREIFATISAKL